MGKWLQVLLCFVFCSPVFSANDGGDVCEQKYCKCKNITESTDTSVAKGITGLLVDCSKLSIHDLSTLTFPTSVATLVLDNNPLQEIPVGVFVNLTNLQSLSMKSVGNKAQSLQLRNGTFLGLSKLTILMMTGTRIDVIEEAGLADLIGLIHLDLSTTTLNSVPNLSSNLRLAELILGKSTESKTLYSIRHNVRVCFCSWQPIGERDAAGTMWTDFS